MGKIRVKALGEKKSEEEQKKRDEERRASKRAKKQGDEKQEAASAEPTKKIDKKAERVAIKEAKKEAKAESIKPTEQVVDKKKKATKKADGTKIPPNRRPTVRSKSYIAKRAKVDPEKRYAINDAIQLVKDTSNIKFDGTIEAHFNLTKKPKDLNLKKDKTIPVSYERKFPLAHAKVGKVKDANADIKTQLETLIKRIGVRNITKLTLTSTMGPGVKVQLV